MLFRLSCLLLALLPLLFVTASPAPPALPHVARGDELRARAPEASPGLIDDLLTGALGPVGQLIKDILDGVKSAQDGQIGSKPAICLQSVDPCCVWYDVSAELTTLFKNSDGTCNDAARAAVRLGFHDAGAWDKTSTHGGADGSLIMDFGEQDRPENNGLQDIRTTLRGVQAKYGVGYADLVQYAHNHATVTCPLGPRIITFVGRPDATQAAPTGLLPDTHSPADVLIQLFADKGFSAADLAALIGAHSAAKQFFVDTSRSGAPLDTTPGTWDVEFYNDTLQTPADPSVFVLPSDKVLSTDSRTGPTFSGFVGAQAAWNAAYARAYVRMSLLGVSALEALTLCSRTLPGATLPIG